MNLQRFEKYITPAIIIAVVAVLFVSFTGKVESSNEKNLKQTSENAQRLIDGRHIQNDYRNTTDEKLDNLTIKMNNMELLLSDINKTLS